MLHRQARAGGSRLALLSSGAESAKSCAPQVYGKDGVFDADRLIDLLSAFEDYSVASKSAQGEYHVLQRHRKVSLILTRSKSGTLCRWNCLPCC